MANICDVSLTARGFTTKSDMDAFAQILHNVNKEETRVSGKWLPYFDVDIDVNYDNNTILGEGWCKWSADRLLDSYVQEAKADNLNITSLEELSEAFGIDIEILGTEPGCEVGQHYLVEGGRLTLEEYFDYNEYEVLDSYEAFVEENGDILDEETWQAHVDDGDEWIPVGDPETPYGILWSRKYKNAI